MTLPADSSHTILIVEDNPDLLEFLQMTLPHLGNYRVVCASDGIAGLEQAIAFRPSCMVIDVKMPGLDGYQLVRTLRGDRETADIPLVILTAMAQERDQFTGMAAGADVYLTKPVILPNLIAAIQEAIRLGANDRADRYAEFAQEDSLELS